MPLYFRKIRYFYESNIRNSYQIDKSYSFLKFNEHIIYWNPTSIIKRLQNAIINMNNQDLQLSSIYIYIYIFTSYSLGKLAFVFSLKKETWVWSKRNSNHIKGTKKAFIIIISKCWNTNKFIINMYTHILPLLNVENNLNHFKIK